MTQERPKTSGPVPESRQVGSESRQGGPESRQVGSMPARDDFGGRETVPPSHSVETETRPGTMNQGEALLKGSDASRFHDRWVAIQAAFVDEPRKAVKDAQQLLEEVFQALNSAFSKGRDDLEAQWERSGEASTEDLRQAVRRYKVLFERLLAA